MNTNYNLKYKTFNQLLDEVSLDFTNYSMENLIDPTQLIKVARRVTYDLGLRINITKETVLNLEKGKAKLPQDFYTFNYGLLCGEYSITNILPQGTHIEEIPYTPYQEVKAHIDTCNQGSCDIPQTMPCGCPTVSVPIPNYNPLVPYGDYCIKPRVFMNCKGQAYELVQIIGTQTRTFKHFLPLKLKMVGNTIECGCPNINLRCKDEIWIRDGWLFANFNIGSIYINYQSDLQDDEGNLLVPDHDLLNEYYEYALKERILENMFMDGEDTANKLSYIQGKLRIARNNANSLVNTPNFAELENMWKLNRRSMEQKYYRMFETFNYRY